MNKFPICLAAAFCWSIPARAAVAGASSIEWLACASDHIAVGRLVFVTPSKNQSDIGYDDCVLSVSEMIKGPPAQELHFRARHDGPDANPWTNVKTDLLVFLRTYTGDAEPLLRGQLVPVASGFDPSVYDLAHLPSVFSKEMTLVTSQEDLLHLARTWAVPVIRDSLRMPAPENSPVVARLYSGSGCYLDVPAEEKYRAKFMALAVSKDPHHRRHAAGELSKYPGPETERVLFELLQDRTEEFWLSNDSVSESEFTVRSAAAHGLTQLGKSVGEVVLRRKATPEEQRTAREEYWRGRFNGALPKDWKFQSLAEGEPRVNVITKELIVTCGNGASTIQFHLFPEEWYEHHEQDLPRGEYLGINSPGSSDARFFVLQGTLPPAAKEKVKSYFGLKK